MFNPAFWWTLVGLGLMICEFVVPGLILFFFGVGALITALAVFLFPLSLTVQLTVFVLASLVSLFGLRRLLKPIFMGRTTDGAEEDGLAEGMAGEEGYVIAPICAEAPGKVSVHGTAWKAESEETLEMDAGIVVVGQKSLTLIVKRK